MDTVGDRIRRERSAQKMSREELGRRVGKKYSYIAELERGGMRSSTILPSIAGALGVSAAWLETGRGGRALPAIQSQSQAARLTGEMIRSAFGEARNLAMQGGAEADDFNPAANADDAGILAVVLNRLLRQSEAGQDSSTAEIVDGSSGRTGATRRGEDAPETRGEGIAAPRKPRKRAA